MYRLAMTDALEAAAGRWCKVDRSKQCELHFATFMDGITMKQIIDEPAWTMLISLRAMDRLELLLGPNYHTVIKAYLARITIDES